jgi:tetratricopeptide (TPR) repeat protein
MSVEATRIELLTAETDTWRLPSKWLDRERHEQAYASSRDDGIRFQAILGLAEQSRRRWEWDAALDYLRKAYSQNYGDDRRVANVQYRTARLFLHQARYFTGNKRRTFGRTAVGYASDAVRIFRKMDNQVGAIRAEALLVSALRLADHKGAAAEIVDRLDAQVLNLGATDPARTPLQARVLRCQGEGLMEQRDYERACRVFSRAIDLYTYEDDWQTTADILRSLGNARAGNEQWGLAVEALQKAAAYYSQCEDERAQRAVEREIEEIMRRMGSRSYQPDHKTPIQ